MKQTAQAKTGVPTPDTASKDRLRLWLRLLKTRRAVETALRTNLRTQFQSTLPRFDVMAALSRYPAGLKMSEISGLLRVSNSNVTGIVDRLVEEGLIERIAVKGDRRASRVRLTEVGQDEFSRQAAAHEVWIDDMLSDFSAQEAKDIAAVLKRMS